MEALVIRNSATHQQAGKTLTPVKQLAGKALTLDLLDRFSTFLDASPKTVQTYVRAVYQFYKWKERHGIALPTRKDILAYRDELKETCKPTTVQNYIIALRVYYQFLETLGYENVAERIKGARISKEHKKSYLTSSQVKTVLRSMERDTAQGRRDYAIFLLMVTGGLRDVEVSRANIEDLTILGDFTVLYLQGKYQDERAVYVKVPAEVETAIRDSLADRKNTDGKQPLFVSLSNNSKGERISTRSVSGMVKATLKKAGYNSDRLTAHSLRHTAVTLSLLGGNTLQEVQQFARHSNIATTLIYAHNLDRAENNCGNTIANAIF